MAENANTLQNIDELKNQIDYLEEQIRQAEQVANSVMEGNAPIRSIYKWQAPERLHEPKNQNWFVGVGLLVVVIIAYSALTANYLLILVLLMLMMLLYAMNTFPPKMLEHEILNKGLKTSDKLYTWSKIESFWVSRRGTQYVLNLNLQEGRIKRMILLVGQGNVDTIVQEMVKRVDYINPGGTNQDILSRLTEGKHMPLTKFFDVFEQSKTRQPVTAAKPAPPAMRQQPKM